MRKSNKSVSCLSQNYCTFNNKFYQQKDGLPMGSPISPLLAEIFMSTFENKLFTSKNPLVNSIHFWARYVDDIICIWKGSDRQLTLLLDFLNSFYPAIKFTQEIEVHQQLNFLDLTICRMTDSLDYKIFRKPTSTDTVIPSDSYQSYKVKMAAFHSLTHRILNIPLSKTNYNTELDKIHSIATNNGYPPSMIDRMIHRKRRDIILKSIYPTPSENPNNKFYKLNYVKGTSNKIINILKKYNIRTTCINSNNIGKILTNSKDKRDKLSKSGIYSINCNECNAVYYGQTGRNLGIRATEHLKAITKGESTTGFSAHCIENNHTFSKDKINLLHPGRKGVRLNLLEHLEIRRGLKTGKFVTNDLTVFNSSTLVNPL